MSHAGHLQALSVGAQAEAGLSGALSDRPEEDQEEKPGKALVQVWDQRERGETETQLRPFPPFQNMACTACDKSVTSVQLMWRGGQESSRAIHTTTQRRRCFFLM